MQESTQLRRFLRGRYTINVFQGEGTQLRCLAREGVDSLRRFWGGGGAGAYTIEAFLGRGDTQLWRFQRGGTKLRRF